MVVYHVNPKTNRPNICRADKKGCPLSKEGAKHFDNKDDARDYAEKSLGEKSNFMQSSSKKTPVNNVGNENNVNSVSNEDTQRLAALKDEINNTLGANKDSAEQLRTMDLEKLDKVGVLVNEEIVRGLSFNPNDIAIEDFSSEQLQEIEDSTNKVFARLTDVGGKLERGISGTRAKEVEKVISVLPTAAKNFVPKEDFATKTTNKNSHLAGSYTRAYVEEVSPLEDVVSPFSINSYENAAPGEFFENSGVIPIEVKSGEVQSFRVMKKGENTQYFEGKKPAGSKGWKKVASSVEVTIGEEKVTVEKPVYQMTEKTEKIKQVLSVHEVKDKRSESLALHEYTHAVQRNYYYQTNRADVHSVDDKMFESLAGKTYPSKEYDMDVHTGFTNDYMASQPVELLPVATESLFKPGAVKGFYGKDRHPNADKLRNWTAGMWLHLDALGKAENR